MRIQHISVETGMLFGSGLLRIDQVIRLVFWFERCTVHACVYMQEDEIDFTPSGHSWTFR